MQRILLGTTLVVLLRICLVGMTWSLCRITAAQPIQDDSGKQAYEDYQRAPQSPNVLLNYAISLMKQERYVEAREVLGELRRVDPAHPLIESLEHLLAQLEREPNKTAKLELVSDWATNMLGEMNKMLQEASDDLPEADVAIQELSAMSNDLVNAAGRGDIQTVVHLLDGGVSPDVKDSFDNTPIHMAAFRGHEAVVRELLARGADVNLRGMVFEQTPLLVAALSGHAAVVQVLLDAGADVNAKNKEGVTALQLARKRGHSGVVNLLIQAGAQE